MVLPRVFSNERERILASYNFVDIISGTGFVTVYGYDTIDDTTITRRLEEQIVFSHQIHSDLSPAFSGTGGTFIRRGIANFDLSPFNLPRTIKGDVHVTLPWLVGQATTGTTETYLVAVISKWDGSTETPLASSQTKTLNLPGASTKTNLANMAITVPRTLFKKGESVRLTIEQWSKWISGNSAVTTVTIAHSPKNRDGTAITVANTGTTQLILNVPFDIDL